MNNEPSQSQPSRSQPLRSQSSRSLSWAPLLGAALLGIGVGVSGTLVYIDFLAPISTQASSTRIEDTTSNALNSALNNAPFSGTNLVPDLPTPSVSATSPQAALSRGNVLYDAQNWAAAEVQYRQAIAGGLDNPDVRTDLGNCYRFLNQPQKALQQYLLAQKQNPQHEQSLFNQGGLYAFSLNQPVKAVALWKQYLQRFPQGRSVTEAKQLIAQFENR